MEEKQKATANQATANAKDNAKIQILSKLATPALHVPLDGLPLRFQGIVNTFAMALDCPPEYILGSAVTAIAQAAGNRFSWTNGKYKCFPQFYMGIVGDSTANKTSAINKIFAPLERADRVSYQEYERATGDMKREDKARTPYKMGVLTDYTLEAYLDALKFNPDGVTAKCDEILTFFGNAQQYKKDSQDEKFFLTCYGSYSDYKKARRGVGLEFIKEPIPRIIGGIQPKIMGRYFQGRNASMLEDGLLVRFLFVFVPEDYIHDEKGMAALIDTTTEDKLWSRIVGNIKGQKNRVSVAFDSEAAQRYQEFKNAHAQAKNAKTLSGYEAAVCGKLEIHAIMWAMAMRIIRYGLENRFENQITITGAEMEYSLRCMAYFRQTAMRAYDIITDTGGAKSTDKAEWFRAGYLKGFFPQDKSQTDIAEFFGTTRQKINDFFHGRR